MTTPTGPCCRGCGDDEAACAWRGGCCGRCSHTFGGPTHRLVWLWPCDPDAAFDALLDEATQALAEVATKQHVRLVSGRFTVTEDTVGTSRWLLVFEGDAVRETAVECSPAEPFLPFEVVVADGMGSGRWNGPAERREALERVAVMRAKGLTARQVAQALVTDERSEDSAIRAVQRLVAEGVA